MASNKVEMSLDDIIKGDRKTGKGKQVKKGGIRKAKPGQTKLGKKNAGGPKKQQGNTAATKKLVQQLVKKALAQNTGRKVGAGRRGVRTVVRKGNNQGISQRSRVIKKGGPRTETVIVRKFVKPRPQPRQQIIREVIVQEPARRVITQPIRRFNNNRPKVVYVQQQSQGRPQGRPQFRQNQGGRRPQFQQRPRFQQQQRRNFDPQFTPVNYLQRF